MCERDASGGKGATAPLDPLSGGHDAPRTPSEPTRTCSRRRWPRRAGACKKEGPLRRKNAPPPLRDMPSIRRAPIAARNLAAATALLLAGGVPLPSRTVNAAKSDPNEHPFNGEPSHADRAARRRSGPKKRSVSVRSASGTLRRGLGGGSPPSGCRAAPCPPEAFLLLFLLFLPPRSTRSRCGSGPEGGPWRDCARRAGRCAQEAP